MRSSPTQPSMLSEEVTRGRDLDDLSQVMLSAWDQYHFFPRIERCREPGATAQGNK